MAIWVYWNRIWCHGKLGSTFICIQKFRGMQNNFELFWPSGPLEIWMFEILIREKMNIISQNWHSAWVGHKVSQCRHMKLYWAQYCRADIILTKQTNWTYKIAKTKMQCIQGGSLCVSRTCVSAKLFCGNSKLTFTFLCIKVKPD